MSMLSMVKNLPAVIKRGGGKVIFKLSKNKPQILFGAGAVITVGGFVWAVINPCDQLIIRLGGDGL